MEFPCPVCDHEPFQNPDDLLTHALYHHSPQNLTDLIRKEQAMKQLTQADFVQVDSHWIYAVNGFHLSLAPNEDGKFKLMVYGTVEPLPAATTYPTEPEWDKALVLANKFLGAYYVAQGE